MERKEAIEVLRKYSPKDAELREALETAVPELKESEDERIISRIKKAVESYWSDEPLDEILAWLEKHATPQVRTGVEWVNTIDDACDKRYAEEYAQGEYCHEQSFRWGFFEGVEWCEKQGSQNLANSAKTCKVEPKFKVGDWVTIKE